VGGRRSGYFVGGRTFRRRPSVMPVMGLGGLGGFRGGYMSGQRTVVAGKRAVDENRDKMKRYAFGHVSGHIGIHGHVYAEDEEAEPY